MPTGGALRVPDAISNDDDLYQVRKRVMNPARITASSPDRCENRVPINVFVVSPNSNLRLELYDKLGPPHWNVIQSSGGAGALELLRKHKSDDSVLLLDPMLLDLESSEFCRIVTERFPHTQVLMMNSNTGQLMAWGAQPTPVSITLTEAVNGRATVPTITSIVPDSVSPGPLRLPETEHRLRTMMGESESMRRTFAAIRMVAVRDTTVLITGESGTGKDLVALEIHQISQRRKQPLIIVNCAAIPETLLEAELFGHTKGSFTGATQSRIGRIQAAHGGTLFLDEIGDMPLSLQSKILRFLEQGEVQRLGANDNLRVDVRVIAATNADLKSMVAEQRFREDLYYRLAVFPIRLPPLRSRISDLKELADAFLAKFRPDASLSSDALQILEGHNWKGNVRELRNAIERATILVGSGQVIKPEHIVL